MEDTYKIEIVTPEKIIFSDDKVLEVILPSYEGEMGILKDHIPIISFLRPGIVKILKSSKNINSFFVEKDGHNYEAFIQSDFSFSNNVSAVEQEERIYQTSITINVLGYLYGQDTNDNEPKLFKQEGVAKIKITGEKEMLSEKTTKKV